MREILFRGKTKAISGSPYNNGKPDGEWVEGHLYNDVGCWKIRQFEIDYADYIPYEVDPETIEQYAELTDKNAKKVFDGDILKNEYEKNKYQYFKVYYCNITHSWLVENKYGMLGKLYNVIGDIEIIGNIHDNPELLRTPQNDEVRE